MPRMARLDADATADVCIVGAGIAGLTTAYLLAREGVDVMVVDDGPIGGGETSCTTAHLSYVLDDRFSRMESMHGINNVRRSVESNMAAINTIEQIVRGEEIACDFSRVDGYLFVPPGDEGGILDDEFTTAHRLGLTDTTWEERAPLGTFDTGACLRFPNQATFHPLKYLSGLAKAAVRDGVRIYTGTHIEEQFETGKPVRIHSRDGHTIAADAVVVATNAPALNFLEVQAKQSAMRTYALAIAIPRGSVPNSLFWDTMDPYHYVRIYREPDWEHDLLIVGGEDHKTGQERAPEDRHVVLEAWTRERFPFATAVQFKWSGQVIEPTDGFPYIGRYEKGERNIYCITSDSGQGMTHGTAAAIMTSDMILGRRSEWKEIYAPARKRLRAVGALLSEQSNNVRQYAEWLTGGRVASSDLIEAGTGAVIREGAHKIAAYRDADGTLHELSAMCTHLGCVVHWNSLENTWDCPCHGSRFTPTGQVINGPATADLKPFERPHDASAAVMDAVDDASEQSFPASDPPSFTPARSGPPMPPSRKRSKRSPSKP